MLRVHLSFKFLYLPLSWNSCWCCKDSFGFKCLLDQESYYTNDQPKWMVKNGLQFINCFGIRKIKNICVIIYAGTLQYIHSSKNGMTLKKSYKWGFLMPKRKKMIGSYLCTCMHCQTNLLLKQLFLNNLNQLFQLTFHFKKMS